MMDPLTLTEMGTKGNKPFVPPSQPETEIMADNAPAPVTPTPTTDTSKIGGVSVRGIIALILVLSLCSVCVYIGVTGKGTVPEALTNAALVVLSFYFGHEVGASKSTK